MQRLLIVFILTSLPLTAWSPSNGAPDLSLDAFVVPEGLEITAWAASPMLFNPTNMDVDQFGRIWITEGVNYRKKKDRRPEGDRIIILEDTDLDGKADKSTVFWQDPELIAPLGIAVFDNVVLVSQPPNLLKLTDVNRDGLFDEKSGDTKENFLTGFNGRNHDHSLHSVTGSPDGKWVFNQGNMGAAFTDKANQKFYIGGPYVDERYSKNVADVIAIAGKKSADGFPYNSGAAFRINPDGTGTSVIGHGFRNSYEQITNSFGFVFQNDNDDPPACRVTHMIEHGNAGYFSRNGKRTWRADQRPGQDIPTAEWRQEDPGVMPAGDVYGGGSPTGITFYENGVLGDDFIGSLLSCEPGRNVVFQYQPELSGAGFLLERKDFTTTNPEKVFDGSDFVGGNPKKYDMKDNQASIYQFRPADITVGVDGAIYIADWTDARVGGHDTLDEAASGIIYRIAPPGFKPSKPGYSEVPSQKGRQFLESPANNVRWLGFNLLKKLGPDALPAVLEVLANNNPYVSARAIWLLPYMGPEGAAKIETLLTDPDPLRRITAFRALRRADQKDAALTAASKLANDENPAIRAEAALEMRYRPWSEAKEILVTVANRFDGKDRSYLESLGLGAGHKTEKLWQALRENRKETATKWPEEFAWLTWRLMPLSAVPELLTRAQSSEISEPHRKLAIDSLAFIDDESAAEALIEIAGNEHTHTEYAKWWLRNRSEGEWNHMDLHDTLVSKGIIIPPVELVESVMPPEKSPRAYTTSDVYALKGDAGKGKLAANRCMMCHQIDGQGVEYGPSLKGFGSQQPREVVIRSIVEPSHDISHGYDGHRVTLKDDKKIEGMILSENKNMVVRSIGGLTQTIPKDQIKDRHPMKTSLMLSAEQLGLSAQDVADIVEWMKDY